LSYSNTIKLELNHKRNNKETLKNMKNMLLHDQWVIKEIREEIKKFLGFNEMKAQPIRALRHSKGCAKGKVHTFESIYKKHRKISNK
jgi:ATP-dependent Clp protease adapter protein ClpS